MKNQADLYRMLGVNPSAGRRELNEGFRRKVKKCHPDLRTDKQEARREFLQLRTALDLLSDPEQRAAYDATRPASAGSSDTRTAKGQDKRNTTAEQEERYRDEWEMFVHDPVSYTDYYRAPFNIVVGSVIGTLAGTVGAVLVTTGVMVACMLFANFIAMIISFASAAAISSLVGIIAMFFALKEFGEYADRVFEAFEDRTTRLMRWSVRQLPNRIAVRVLQIQLGIELTVTVTLLYLLNDAIISAVKIENIIIGAIIFILLALINGPALYAMRLMSLMQRDVWRDIARGRRITVPKREMLGS